jgi:hypothetical protein
MVLGQVFAELFGFPCQYYSIVALRTLYNLGDEPQACWWLQFRDMVLSPSTRTLSLNDAHFCCSDLVAAVIAPLTTGRLQASCH